MRTGGRSSEGAEAGKRHKSATTGTTKAQTENNRIGQDTLADHQQEPESIDTKGAEARTPYTKMGQNRDKIRNPTRAREGTNL